MISRKESISFLKTNNCQPSITPFKKMIMVLFHSFGSMLMKKIKVKTYGFLAKSGNHRLTHSFHARLKFWACKGMYIFIQASLQDKMKTFKEL